jgi:translation initiation factor IF-2
MPKVRVYEIAKQLNISNKELLDIIADLGINVKNHMSALEDEETKIIMEMFKKEDKTEADTIENETQGLEDEVKTIQLSLKVTVKELADALERPSSEIVKILMSRGIMLSLNEQVDFTIATEIAATFNVIVEQEQEVDILEEIFAEEPENEKDLEDRSPVVVVMGHVDHGKTSLLDVIRHSSVTASEAGGITQHIGAYTVQINGKNITFLDTPGHEAFTAMRMRGAQVTDIAILVVAADDGIMPQTVEAINHAKAANVEIIVAINKMDKPGANPDRVKQELTEYGLLAEDWGGQTICVPVSALKKEGIDTLLEMVLLAAEMKELKANPNKPARGTIIEAQLDKGRGPVATVLIQSGSLKVGDPVVVGSTYGKIRAMTDDKGKKLKKAGPSTPVEILGLSEVPFAGDMFYVAKSDKHARQVAETVVAKGRVDMIRSTPNKVSLDDLFTQIQTGNVKELNIVVKADVQGSVEAVKQSLEKLSNEEVRIRTIHGGVGAINESDVMLAAASGAIIIGFNVRPESSAKSFADEQKVDVRLYRIIYNAIDDIQSAMKGMLEPVFREKITGHAEIRQTFKASGLGTIGGSYILDGKFVRGSKVRIIRDQKVVYDGELEGLKRFKDDVKEVKEGYECGLLFNKFNDIKEGDQVEAFIMEEVPR